MIYIGFLGDGWRRVTDRRRVAVRRVAESVRSSGRRVVFESFPPLARCADRLFRPPCCTQTTLKNIFRLQVPRQGVVNTGLNHWGFGPF